MRIYWIFVEVEILECSIYPNNFIMQPNQTTDTDDRLKKEIYKKYQK